MESPQNFIISMEKINQMSLTFFQIHERISLVLHYYIQYATGRDNTSLRWWRIFRSA